jgi:hypothetical protein
MAASGVICLDVNQSDPQFGVEELWITFSKQSEIADGAASTSAIITDESSRREQRSLDIAA